jgi:hypothetical protein
MDASSTERGGSIARQRASSIGEIERTCSDGFIPRGMGILQHSTSGARFRVPYSDRLIPSRSASTLSYHEAPHTASLASTDTTQNADREVIIFFFPY